MNAHIYVLEQDEIGPCSFRRSQVLLIQCHGVQVHSLIYDELFRPSFVSVLMKNDSNLVPVGTKLFLNCADHCFILFGIFLIFRTRVCS